jgi:hypothetical protein
MAELSIKIGGSSVISGGRTNHAATLSYDSRTLRSCSVSLIMGVCDFIYCGKTQAICCGEAPQVICRGETQTQVVCCFET